MAPVLRKKYTGPLENRKPKINVNQGASTTQLNATPVAINIQDSYKQQSQGTEGNFVTQCPQDFSSSFQTQTV